MSKASDRLGWLAGLLVGAGAAAVFLIGEAAAVTSLPPAPVPDAPGAALQGAAVFTVSVVPIGELAVTPTEIRLAVAGPESAAASFGLFNQTGRALAVTLRAVGGEEGLSPQVQARVVVSGRTAYEGPLANLAAGAPLLVIGSGQAAPVEFELSLPGGPCPGCRGAVSLQLGCEAEGV